MTIRAPKPKPIRRRDPNATHAEEMRSRKAARDNRIPNRERRTRQIWITGPDGTRLPMLHTTMWDGLRLARSGAVRSKSYKRFYGLPTNALGEIRR